MVLDIGKIPFLKQYYSTVSMTKTVISDDHNMIAFGLDLKNDENTVWMIRNIKEDKIYRDKLYGCANAKFTEDGTALIYS